MYVYFTRNRIYRGVNYGTGVAVLPDAAADDFEQWKRDGDAADPTTEQINAYVASHVRPADAVLYDE